VDYIETLPGAVGQLAVPMLRRTRRDCCPVA